MAYRTNVLIQLVYRMIEIDSLKIIHFRIIDDLVVYSFNALKPECVDYTSYNNYESREVNSYAASAVNKYTT